MASNRIEEIEQEEETKPLIQSPESDPNLKKTRSVRTKVPEAELHVYKQGKGPIDVYKTCLGGWDQDQLEIRDILEKHGFKFVYAFSPGSGRSMPIRFNQRNGRSILTYGDGAVIYIDGEPKDSLINPITKILLGVVLITLLFIFVMREAPEWVKKFNFSGAGVPPWILACVVIVFTRMRKRTKNFLGKYFQ